MSNAAMTLWIPRPDQGRELEEWSFLIEESLLLMIFVPSSSYNVNLLDIGLPTL